MVGNEEFTVEQGKEVQRRHLQEWEMVLHPEVFKMLVGFVVKVDKARSIANGYDVCRGSDIDNIAHQIKHHLWNSVHGESWEKFEDEILNSPKY